MMQRFIALALALLLAFAQHAALAHAIEHHAPLSQGDGHEEGPAGHAHHEAYAHDQPAPAAPEGAHANCALDALYVQVLGGAGATTVPSLPYAAPREPGFATAFLSALPAAVLAAAPRGPPAATLPL